MTVKEWLNHITTEFSEASIATARIDALALLEHATKRDRSWLLAHDDTLLDNKQHQDLVRMKNDRLSGVPLAYIIEKKEFYGREFIVSTATLIPRPETESFIPLLTKLRKKERIHSILDMGTGTGCLAITIKKEFPDLYVFATDISEPALKVAARNSLIHDAAVTFKNQSLLQTDKEMYDVIAANLPYVPEDMNNPSIMHEPAGALFSGADGLDHYRALFTQLALKYIRYVLTESLSTQHTELEAIAADAHYRLIDTDGLVQVFTKTTRQEDI